MRVPVPLYRTFCDRTPRRIGSIPCCRARQRGIRAPRTEAITFVPRGRFVVEAGDAPNGAWIGALDLAPVALEVTP